MGNKKPQVIYSIGIMPGFCHHADLLLTNGHTTFLNAIWGIYCKSMLIMPVYVRCCRWSGQHLHKSLKKMRIDYGTAGVMVVDYFFLKLLLDRKVSSIFDLDEWVFNFDKWIINSLPRVRFMPPFPQSWSLTRSIKAARSAAEFFGWSSYRGSGDVDYL